MKRFLESYKSFISKYLTFVILFFAFLSMLTYVVPVFSINNQAGLIYRGVVSVIIFILIVSSLILFKIRPSNLTLILLFVYLVSGILSVAIAPTLLNTDISTINYLAATFSLVMNCLSVISIITIFNQFNIDPKMIKITCWIVIGFTLFLILYSYCAQMDQIIATFTKEYGWNYDVKSIFTEKTSYGFCLLIGSVFAVFLALFTKKYWIYAFPVFFLVNTFISRNKTAALATIVLLLAVLIYHIITSFKKYKKAWIITLSVSFGVILLFILLIFVDSIRPAAFDNIYKFFNEVIIHDGQVVLEDRFNKWSSLVNTVNKNTFTIFFGLGDRLSTQILPKISGYQVSDSVYVVNYAYGGLVKFLLYFVFLGYFYYQIIRYQKNTLAKFTSLLFLSITCVAGVFEDDNIIGYSMNALYLLIPLFILPKTFSIAESSKVI